MGKRKMYLDIVHLTPFCHRRQWRLEISAGSKRRVEKKNRGQQVHKQTLRGRGKDALSTFPMFQQGRRCHDTAVRGSTVLQLKQCYSKGTRTQHWDNYFMFFHYLLDNKMVFQLLNAGTSVYMLECQPQEILIGTRCD